MALQTVGLVLVMLAILEIVVYIITQQALLGSLETTLQQRTSPPADVVRSTFHLEGFPGAHGPGSGGPVDTHGPNPHGPSPYLNPSDASSIFVDPRLNVVHTDGTLNRTVLDTASLRAAIKTGASQCCSVRRYKGQDYLVYTKPLRVQGRLVGAVQASISEHQFEDAMGTLLRTLLVVALLGLIGSGGVSFALTRRAMRPIRVAVQRQRDFVADAAHELRTPLAIQRTVAEVALNDESLQNHEITVEQMLVENKHLTRLVDDLSLLARADSHAVSITPAPMNLSVLVAETASELSPLAEERGMTMTVNVAERIWVLGDIMRLRQLLLVLLDNALKYSPSGGNIGIGLQSAGGRVQLQVSDSGPGIDPADLPRIFDRFYRADRARASTGSGLGLAIATWVVEAHGGQLHAANRVPHGAILTAILPITRAIAPS